MRRLAILGVASVAVIGISHRITTKVLRAQGSGAVPSYSATVAVKQFDPSGRLVRTKTIIKGERRDGSRASALEVLDSRPVGTRSVLDPRSGRRIAVDPTTESVTTYMLSPAEVAGLSGPVQCRPGEAGAGGTGVILGFPTIKQTHRVEAGFRSAVQESWVAPALNCLPLRVVTDVVDNGRPKAHIVEEAVSVTLGDPDPSLFAVPDGYTERSPSEVFAEKAKRAGRPCTTCALPTTQGLDAVYHASGPR